MPQQTPLLGWFGVGKLGAELEVLVLGGGWGWPRLTTSLPTPIHRDNACAGVRISGWFRVMLGGSFLRVGWVPFTLVPTDVPAVRGVGAAGPWRARAG